MVTIADLKQSDTTVTAIDTWEAPEDPESTVSYGQPPIIEDDSKDENQ